MFLSDLIIKKVRGKSDKYVVCEPLEYQAPGKLWTVPQGFETDLSTFWLEGRHTDCAVLHDWVLHVTDNDFKRANKVMDEAMESVGTRWLNRKLIMLGVEANRYFKSAVKYIGHIGDGKP